MGSVLTKQIKDALESGDFAAALPLIEEYGEEVKAALYQARTPDERCAILAQGSAYIQDRLHLARVLRTHLAAKLAKASCLYSYGTAAHEQSSWSLQG